MLIISPDTLLGPLSILLWIPNKLWYHINECVNVVKTGVTTTDWSYFETRQRAEAGRERYGNHNGWRYSNGPTRLTWKWILPHSLSLSCTTILLPILFHLVMCIHEILFLSCIVSNEPMISRVVMKFLHGQVLLY